MRAILPRLGGQPALAWLGQRVGGVQARVEHLPGGIWHCALSTRMTRLNGMEVSSYRVGRILVDTGFSHVRQAVLGALDEQRIDAIALTHHHEDHAGNAGAIASRHDCPIYLREPSRRLEEGLDALRSYRLLWWGVPGPYEPLPLPERLEAGGETLLVVPIEGHSATHSSLFHEHTGAVFTGDLYVSGCATAVMRHENPYRSIASLRAVASLEPRWMLTGHGRAIEAPAATLRQKADAIEQAAAEVRRLHARGLPEHEIVRQIFHRSRAKDRWLRWLTDGEFSRDNFVGACLRYAPPRPNGRSRRVVDRAVPHERGGRLPSHGHGNVDPDGLPRDDVNRA